MILWPTPGLAANIAHGAADTNCRSGLACYGRKLGLAGRRNRSYSKGTASRVSKLLRAGQ